MTNIKQGRKLYQLIVNFFEHHKNLSQCIDLLLHEDECVCNKVIILWMRFISSCLKVKWWKTRKKGVTRAARCHTCVFYTLDNSLAVHVTWLWESIKYFCLQTLLEAKHEHIFYEIGKKKAFILSTTFSALCRISFFCQRNLLRLKLFKSWTIVLFSTFLSKQKKLGFRYVEPFHTPHKTHLYLQSKVTEA